MEIFLINSYSVSNDVWTDKVGEMIACLSKLVQTDPLLRFSA